MMVRLRLSALCVLAAAGAVMAAACSAATQDIVLEFPVRCELGRSCEIQNYVDRDPVAGSARDYRHGARTYDAHNGTDIRLPTLAAQASGVPVLAAASGEVLRVRDGVDDVSVRRPGGLEAVAGSECGNGVIVAHPGGWETQYCHLAKGSVRVRPGQDVTAGEPIGMIGMSGETEYPHLHFTVRKGTEVVDPFAPGLGAPLWRTTPAYKAGAVLNTGFASGPVTMEMIEAGKAVQPDAGWPALVVYGRAIGLRAGDVQELVLRSPDGSALATHVAESLPRDQAQSMVFTGERRPPEGWPRGTYLAEYRVRRGGAIVLDARFSATM